MTEASAFSAMDVRLPHRIIRKTFLMPFTHNLLVLPSWLEMSVRDSNEIMSDALWAHTECNRRELRWHKGFNFVRMFRWCSTGRELFGFNLFKWSFYVCIKIKISHRQDDSEHSFSCLSCQRKSQSQQSFKYFFLLDPRKAVIERADDGRWRFRSLRSNFYADRRERRKKFLGGRCVSVTAVMSRQLIRYPWRSS